MYLSCSSMIQTRGSACLPQHALAGRARHARTWTPAVSAASLSLAALRLPADDLAIGWLTGCSATCHYLCHGAQCSIRSARRRHVLRRQTRACCPTKCSASFAHTDFCCCLTSGCRCASAGRKAPVVYVYGRLIVSTLFHKLL